MPQRDQMVNETTDYLPVDDLITKIYVLQKQHRTRFTGKTKISEPVKKGNKVEVRSEIDGKKVIGEGRNEDEAFTDLLKKITAEIEKPKTLKEGTPETKQDRRPMLRLPFFKKPNR